MFLYRIVDAGDTWEIREYPVIKETPKGKWIQDTWFDRKRFVLNNSRKCFAHASKEKALDSFVYRKMFQLKIYQQKLKI